MSTAQKNALANHRRRRRCGGVVRVEIQAPAIDAPVLREIAAVLRKSTPDAQELRAKLRAMIAQSAGASVFDTFGSDLPDDYFEGVFDHPRRPDLARDVDL
jgi:hypothetical protein